MRKRNKERGKGLLETPGGVSSELPKRIDPLRPQLVYQYALRLEGHRMQEGRGQEKRHHSWRENHPKPGTGRQEEDELFTRLCIAQASQSISTWN